MSINSAAFRADRTAILIPGCPGPGLAYKLSGKAQESRVGAPSDKRGRAGDSFDALLQEQRIALPCVNLAGQIVPFTGARKGIRHSKATRLAVGLEKIVAGHCLVQVAARALAGFWK